jgi:UDP-N-acetylmuramoyl-tripeptide--D-alanyl-D-alanine ligase
VTSQTGPLAWLVLALGALAGGLGGVRWVRVAQREHYLPGSVLRFAGRWWRCSPGNGLLAVLGLAGLAGAQPLPPLGLAAVLAGGVGPVGLGLRGRSAPLAWTRRARTLAGLSGALGALGLALAGLFGAPALGGAAVALGSPVLVELGLRLTAPVERRLLQRHVDRAASRLRRVRPQVVAITGSYGKTTTKGYVAHLVAGARSVLASPASFNNRAGLARAINEQLAPGTEVFVAEMGTYGPGEIASLCSWVPPDVAMITAIGPVHLERMGSEERILAAKSEILVRAPQVVLAVDDPRLAAVAARCAEEGKTVWWASGGGSGASLGDPERRVLARRTSEGLEVLVGGDRLAAGLTLNAQPSNVACAVAAALALGVPAGVVAERLPGLPVAAHRLAPATGPEGLVIVDDTYNSNPAGAKAALEVLAAQGGPGSRRAVVSPGMVEMGPRQAPENRAFAKVAAEIADAVVVVGRTNRRALVAGVRDALEAGRRCELVVVADRSAAVAWVRQHLGPGDVVLYENDLPDHYP